jgi:hypothetical protein
MNPFLRFIELSRDLRAQILFRYATWNRYTPEEAAAVDRRLKEVAADCRTAARRMGCPGGVPAVDALLDAVVQLFHATGEQWDPYSRANKLDAALPAVTQLSDDYAAELRFRQGAGSLLGPSTETTAGGSASGDGGRPDDQLPREGEKFSEEDAPAAYRDGGKPKRPVLTTTYLKDTLEWQLLGSYLSKNYGPGKPLTRHIKVGREKAYLFNEAAALRTIKTANQVKREEKG